MTNLPTLYTGSIPGPGIFDGGPGCSNGAKAKKAAPAKTPIANGWGMRVALTAAIGLFGENTTSLTRSCSSY